MLNHKDVSIEINGVLLPSFVQLMLKQSINTHHYFDITLDIQAVESYSAGTLDVSKDWVGKKVRLHLGERTFVGIATSVGLHRSDGTHGNIRISGMSSTFLLESAPTCSSWRDKSLSYIVKELSDKCGVQSVINPETKSKIEYECQYGETNFGFIQRLARQYSEWLYYDGLSLVFGKPDFGPSIPLTYGRDLYELDVCSQIVARPLQGSSYSSSSDQTYSGKSPDSVSGLGQLGKCAFDASMALFPTPAVQHAEPRISSKGDLDAHFQRKQQGDAASSHFITGESSCMDLTVGSIIDVSSESHTGIGSYTEQSVGSYIVTEIVHVAGMGGSYRNSFTALPSSVPTLPSPDVPLPVAQTQQATVVNNDDPKHLGRVQVRMGWQTGGMQTSWIRVLTPDAGVSDKVSSNRGFVFIPEKGDQVMVAFRYDDPNRPFVLGSLFHGKSGTGGGDSNKTKSLTTRSGCTVTLDDEKGSVTMKDKEGNSYTADGEGNITISASKSITLCVGENKIMIDSEGNISSNAEKDITESAGANIAQSAENIDCTASSNYNISSTDFTATGSSSATVSGTTKATIDSSGTTAVTGTIVKLN